jgi:hypothetical protein
MDGSLLQIIHKELLDERFAFRKIVKTLPRKIDYKHKQLFFLFLKYNFKLANFCQIKI